MDENEPPCVSPAPPRNLTSSLLSDISNFKTPRRSSVVNSNFSKSPYPHFFTASKQTPKSSSSNFRRPSMVPSYTSRSKVSTSSRRLKAFELQQSQSSRKAELTKEKSLRSLAKSLTVWLNFLFENPVNCGCDPFENDSGVGNLGKGKRDSGEALGNSKSVGVDTMWRSPKRLRNLGWCGEKKGSEIGSSLTGSKYSTLRESLRDVCSLDDLKQRMQFHLSLGSCKEIFDVMTRVTKNIDEGRIKMKSQCPLVTDFGMKEKAIKALMCYNQVWLRLGLYIIFGGDSFLSDSEVNSDQEMAFLKMVINKQFFSHDGLARAYAYNKMVEGLYRPGYYEALGNVILKRILLLVLVIDRAKSQSCLSLKYGIDGIDGGSPLMFSEKSSIKSSHQLICELLSSDVMHGEGNLLAHLVIIGYKIPYQQSPIVEYDFRVRELFGDLQDGVRLCRAIQLLLHDPSILTKMVVPSDNRKKNLVNCRIALQYLRDAGVSLKDDEGMMITGEDVADGDRELTISLLWNIFVHLQLPLLINGRLLTEEIYKVQGLEQNNQITMSTPPLEMLLNWIQSITRKNDFKLESFASLVDGKGIWFLLDYYFRQEVCCPCLHKEDSGGEQGPQSVMSNTDYHDAVQNFILSQKLTALLGSFPEVLQIGDLLEHNAVVSNQSVIILLAFLSSKLIVKENLEKLNFHKLLCSSCQAQEKRYSRISCSSSEAVTNEEPDRENGEDTTKSFQAIKAWWQDMANQNQNSVGKASNDTLQSSLSSKCTTDSQREIAAVVIQSNIKGLHARRKFRKKMRAICFLQASVRTWLSVKNIQVLEKLNVEEVTLHLSERSANLKPVARYVKFIVERSRFIKLRKSVSVIQKAVRRHQSNLHHELKAALKIQLAWRSYKEKVISSITIQSYVRGWITRRTNWTYKFSSILIQRYCRGWLARRKFYLQREATICIQSAIREFNCMMSFQRCKHAATEVQRLVRGQIVRSRLQGASTLYSKLDEGVSRLPQHSFGMTKMLHSVIKVQRWWREFLHSQNMRRKSAVLIQCHIRGLFARRRTSVERHNIVMIQSHWRGYLTRKASKAQVLDLRVRMQTSAANIDDKKRLINKLLSALSELLSMKNVHNILHICETLESATKYSDKCCEEIVAAGAIDKLLTLIRSASRSIPDQQVSKHALSTLGHLARYPHMADELIDTKGSIQTIFWELLRNKEEAYFIASDVLKKICSSHKGVEAVRKLPALVKRLHALVEELTRKANIEKRNVKGQTGKEKSERRLKEAIELLKLITRR
ncbi:abnormal spindle-like microcephaly-associated protein homolog [Arabidopsis lyrata subsp. lyrata]|uniref:abnormal spindle-like microcephaly-associated protein homolog n=1 Tax=Arabidopsis lyrata subsp. lyrata TaxID=81972 RepID=UPI000A29A5F9|nr:abnormal spindle-like microcephaly-associated protein homolog [Arabidopsis lyrata subsp. lyrata]|eukprot:XP_020873234.1 abnormal spindle-like microcephaly-associated protein homolog [Arabidopsis lyrata subsp. lyrata]